MPEGGSGDRRSVGVERGACSRDGDDEQAAGDADAGQYPAEAPGRRHPRGWLVDPDDLAGLACRAAGEGAGGGITDWAARLAPILAAGDEPAARRIIEQALAAGQTPAA